jgi:hypothetical protein
MNESLSGRRRRDNKSVSKKGNKKRVSTPKESLLYE